MRANINRQLERNFGREYNTKVCPACADPEELTGRETEWCEKHDDWQTTKKNKVEAEKRGVAVSDLSR